MPAKLFSLEDESFEQNAVEILGNLLTQLGLSFEIITPCLKMIRKIVEGLPRDSHKRNLEACCAAAVVTHCKQTGIILQMRDVKPLLRCSSRNFVRVYLYFNRKIPKTGNRTAIARLLHSPEIELPIKQATKNYAVELVDAFPLIFTNTTTLMGAASALALACYLRDQMIKGEVSLTRIAQAYGVASSAVSCRVNRWIREQNPTLKSIRTLETKEWEALARSANSQISTSTSHL